MKDVSDTDSRATSNIKDGNVMADMAVQCIPQDKLIDDLITKCFEHK
jgi:hypothetical protein